MTTNHMPIIDLNEIFSVDTDGEYTVLHFRKAVSKLMVYDPGLYHTAICKSRLSKIDKRDGKLYYRGTNVEEKLGQDFLDVAYEIIFGETDDKKERFKKAVFSYFQLFPEQKALLDTVSLSTHPMDILSIATIALSGIEKKYLTDPLDIAEKSGFIVAQVAITASFIHHRLTNTPWIKQPFSSSSYAEQILVQMHNGQNPEHLQKLGKILNTIMILHAEHGQNCSAATVRNIASARGSIYTGVTSGMAAFNGSIHGGASQFVSAMYEELLKSGLDVDSYVNRKIERKELLMGFGQRTYNRIQNCWDPRVETMYRILTDKSFDFPEVEKYKNAALKLIHRVINDEFFKARNLTPNPDLFNCIFYKLFGAPKEMNTVMLALGRIVGWIANFVEHTQDHYPLTRPCDIDI